MVNPKAFRLKGVLEVQEKFPIKKIENFFWTRGNPSNNEILEVFLGVWKPYL